MGSDKFDSITSEQALHMIDNVDNPDIDLSAEEVEKFKGAFKDPEFLKLFNEYAEEIADPKNRAEHDQYLRQLEGEGRVEEVYGEGVQMITPKAGFVVKTHKKDNDEGTGGHKVFINICHSEKVERAESVKADGGSSWSIPFSLSGIRKEKDKNGKDFDTHDFVVADSTYEMCLKRNGFRNFLVETAIENVERQRYKQNFLEREFSTPKMKHKSATGEPGVLAIRTDKEGKDKTDDSGYIRPIGNPSGYVPEKKAPVATKVPAPEATRSEFKFKEKKEKEPEEVGEVEPKYQVVHRGEVDLKEAWNDNSRERLRDSVPKELVVRINLPRLTSIAGVELDVSSTRILLRKQDMYRLDFQLPHKVDSDKGNAKFDKPKRTLEITLPVIPPPRVAAKAFVEPTLVEEVEATKQATRQNSAYEGGSGDEPDTPAVGSESGECGSSLEVVAVVSEGEEGEQPAPGIVMTENERAWREIMARQDEKNRAEQARAAAEAQMKLEEKKAAAEKAAQEEAENAAAPENPEDSEKYAKVPMKLLDDFYPSEEFVGARLGYVFKLGEDGLGYYQDAKEMTKYGIVAKDCMPYGLGTISLDDTDADAKPKKKKAVSFGEAKPDAAAISEKVSKETKETVDSIKEKLSNAASVKMDSALPGSTLKPRLFDGSVLELD